MRQCRRHTLLFGYIMSRIISLPFLIIYIMCAYFLATFLPFTMKMPLVALLTFTPFKL